MFSVSLSWQLRSVEILPSINYAQITQSWTQVRNGSSIYWLVENYQENTKELSSFPPNRRAVLAWPSFGLKRERAIVLVVVGPLLVGTCALGEDRGNPAEAMMVEEPRALGGLRLCSHTSLPRGKRWIFIPKWHCMCGRPWTLHLIS